MINCLIVDDEPYALEILKRYIQNTPFLRFAGQCYDPADAKRKIENENIDLVFLDILMPGGNGVELARTIVEKCRVIFTTAFDKYALEGFKVHALGYLLKPFSYNEFLSVVNRTTTYFKGIVKGAHLRHQNGEGYLYVKSDLYTVKLNTADIQYIESRKEKLNFFLSTKAEPVISIIDIDCAAENLPSNFIRVHKNYIVNLDRVDVIQRNEIIFGRVIIPIAEKYISTFEDYVKPKLLVK